MDASKAFLRRVGIVAVDLGSTPEGTRAGLSVEVWTARGVWLRTRSGHEVRVYVNDSMVYWEKRGEIGILGPLVAVTLDDVRAFLTRWLLGVAR